MLGKLIVNETLRNLEEWRLWRFVCLDKYGLTLTNICLDAWNWLLVWLFRGAEGACIFLFWLYGSLWRVLLEHILDLTLYIATAWISLLFIDSNSFRGLALNCSPAVIHLELPGVWIRWILLAVRSSLFSGLACCWISFSIHCLLIESCGLTWSCWWKVACL